MRITIVGPRSVGKSTISKILAEKLSVPYIEGDSKGNEALKKYGGLDKVIKEKKFHLLGELGVEIAKETMQKESFVFDLAGGAISSKKPELKEAAEMIKSIVSKESLLIGLLPSKNQEESISFLFEREKNRSHFKDTQKEELMKNVKEDYEKLSILLPKICKYIFYTKDKSPEAIVEEIMKELS